MTTYIVEIFEYKHDDFHSSCWSHIPCATIKRKLTINGNSDIARNMIGEWCKEYTKGINEWRQGNFENYNKDIDETVFRVGAIYSIDSIQHI